MIVFEKLINKKIVKVDVHKEAFHKDCYSLTMYFDDGSSCELWPTTNEEISIDWEDKNENT